MENPLERKLGETTVEEALAAWEEKGPTSYTVALMADALYGVRMKRESAEAWKARTCDMCLHAKHGIDSDCMYGCSEGCAQWDS